MTQQTQFDTGRHDRNTITSSKLGKVARARGWAFTIWHWDTVMLDKMKNFSGKIIGFQSENCPKTGKEHLQGFIYFKNARTKTAAWKIIKEWDKLK